MTSTDTPDATAAGAAPNLEDVAREAGVSLSTASRVLNGASVRPDSRQRVEDAAARLGYVANLAAQAIARGYTRNISIIVEDLREPRSALVAAGVIQAAAEHGYIGTITSASGGRRIVDLLGEVRALSPRTIVWAAQGHDPQVVAPELRLLDGGGGRVVEVGPKRTLPFPFVNTRQHAAGLALARALLRAGYRRPLVLGPTADDVATLALIAGFAEQGVAADVRLVARPGGGSALDAVAAVASGAGGSLATVEVVAAADDELALGVMAAFRRRRVAVGRDIAVAGIGGLDAGRDVRPRLSTVPLDLFGAGVLAAKIALGGLVYDARSDVEAVLDASTPRIGAET